MASVAFGPRQLGAPASSPGERAARRRTLFQMKGSDMAQQDNPRGGSGDPRDEDRGAGSQQSSSSDGDKPMGGYYSTSDASTGARTGSASTGASGTHASGTSGLSESASSADKTSKSK
jgi:hypothetical protein